MSRFIMVSLVLSMLLAHYALALDSRMLLRSPEGKKMDGRLILSALPKGVIVPPSGPSQGTSDSPPPPGNNRNTDYSSDDVSLALTLLLCHHALPLESRKLISLEAKKIVSTGNANLIMNDLQKGNTPPSSPSHKGNGENGDHSGDDEDSQSAPTTNVTGSGHADRNLVSRPDIAHYALALDSRMLLRSPEGKKMDGRLILSALPKGVIVPPSGPSQGTSDSPPPPGNNRNTDYSSDDGDKDSQSPANAINNHT
nr:hypothetical protein CK203_021709 [Ipomoea batatas]